jgi:uncharacterized lipoprotein NlpE involved in copper resistance
MNASIHNVESVKLAVVWQQEMDNGTNVFVRRLIVIDKKGNEIELTLFADSPEKLKV